MKKILFILCLLIGINSICSAEKIRICDFGVDMFIKKYNNVVAVAYPDHPNISIKDKYIIKTLDKMRLFYCSTLNSFHGNGTNVCFIVNTSGYIEKIHITNNRTETQGETSLTYMAVLMTLGLSSNDIDYFCKDLFSTPSIKRVATGRVIVAGFLPASPDVGFDTFVLAAFDGNN